MSDVTFEYTSESIADHFANASDAELESLISRARALLKERDTSRKRDALSRIREIAKEHGLTIDVREKTRKRRSKSDRTSAKTEAA